MCAFPAAGLAATQPKVAGSIANSVNLSGVDAVAISGHYAYVTGYYAGQLVAVDISNPAHPTVVGASAAAPSLVAGTTINISGGYAYVVSKNQNGDPNSNDDGTGDSLTILDIHSDPAVPQIVGTVRDTNEIFGGYGVAEAGGYAYVAGQGILIGQPQRPDTGTGSFAVVNVSDPAAPAIVSHLDNNALPIGAPPDALRHACSVFVSGHYAYVTAAYSDRVTIIDISNPAAPQIVGSVSNVPFPVDIVVRGHYAYVADQTGGANVKVAVLDISNPSTPKLVGSLRSPQLGGAYRIRLHGDFAYIAAVDTSTIGVVDISEPRHPRLAAALKSNALYATTGLDVDSTGRYVVSSSFFQPGQSQPLYPPFPPAPGGGTLTGTIATIRLDPKPIAATIRKGSEPAKMTTSRTASFTFTVNDAVAAVSCRLDRRPAAPCHSTTAQNYGSLRPGRHHFMLAATDSAGKTVRARYTWSVVRHLARHG
jgi:hypothetical protein